MGSRVKTFVVLSLDCPRSYAKYVSVFFSVRFPGGPVASWPGPGRVWCGCVGLSLPFQVRRVLRDTPCARPSETERSTAVFIAGTVVGGASGPRTLWFKNCAQIFVYSTLYT